MAKKKIDFIYVQSFLLLLPNLKFWVISEVPPSSLLSTLWSGV